MIGRHWIFQLVAIGIVFYIDFSVVGTPFVGFFLAIMYFLGSLLSLLKRDKYIAGKRFAYMLLFLVEIIVVSTMVETPPEIDLEGFIKGVVDDMWPTSR